MGEIFTCCQKNKHKKRKKVELKEDKKVIYFYTREGVKKDIELVGQDCFDIIDKDLGEGVKYFSVYDGHGIRGKMASNFAKEEIKKLLLSEKNSLVKFKDRKEADRFFKDIFNQVQKKFQKNYDIYDYSGTCIIAILTFEQQCYIINLGDSRAIIGAKSGSQKIAFQMSVDHKPTREDERKRIDQCGGTVSNERNGTSGPPRIYSLNDDGPGLAVSRTLGDVFGHSVGVSCEPEVAYKELDSDDKFIIIASDGVWDVMNSSEAVGFVFEKERYSKEKIAEDLVVECRTRWERVNDYKKRVMELKLRENEKKRSNLSSSSNIFSIDDITVLICYLNEK